MMEPVRFGIDLFSIRSSGWTPFQYLDYCAKLGAKVVHFSEIRFLGGIEDEAHLKKVGEHARRMGIGVEIGMRSICPTSKAFDPTQGTAEEQIAKMIRAAKLVGSPIVRAFVGTMADRAGPLFIEGNIEQAVKVLRSVRDRVTDAGLKIAIENHAGDMQARELKSLIEAAGKDFVSACLDSGNPLWTIEDPHLTLETLAPYAVTSHCRDTAVWKEPDGRIAVAWTRMGEGNVDIRRYAKRFQELCPGKPFSLEIIVTQPRYFAVQDPAFWENYRNTPAWEFARFLSIAEKGKPVSVRPAAAKEQIPEREREDLESSARFTHEELNI
jgi:3-oxoisoapionate decarboxylase